MGEPGRRQEDQGIAVTVKSTTVTLDAVVVFRTGLGQVGEIYGLVGSVSPTR